MNFGTKYRSFDIFFWRIKCLVWFISCRWNYTSSCDDVENMEGSGGASTNLLLSDGKILYSNMYFQYFSVNQFYFM